jgi:hypothetical protein
MSLGEVLANVTVGYGLAVLTQLAVFPWLDLNATMRESLAIGAIFTVVSLARSYLLRRAFEASRRRCVEPTKRRRVRRRFRDRRLGGRTTGLRSGRLQW